MSVFNVIINAFLAGDVVKSGASSLPYLVPSQGWWLRPISEMNKLSIGPSFISVMFSDLASPRASKVGKRRA